MRRRSSSGFFHEENAEESTAQLVLDTLLQLHADKADASRAPARSSPEKVLPRRS
jgi:hypothetical protein